MEKGIAMAQEAPKKRGRKPKNTTPEGNSGLFSGTMGEKALKRPENKEPMALNYTDEVTPLTLDGYRIGALWSRDTGEFRYREKAGTVVWITPEGLEVAVPARVWRRLEKDLAAVLNGLGVPKDG